MRAVDSYPTNTYSSDRERDISVDGFARNRFSETSVLGRFLPVLTGCDFSTLARCYAEFNGRVRPRLCKNAWRNEIVGRLRCPKRVLRRFRRGVNAKPTPENVRLARFYTAWSRSGRKLSLQVQR